MNIKLYVCCYGCLKTVGSVCVCTILHVLNSSFLMMTIYVNMHCKDMTHFKRRNRISYKMYFTFTGTVPPENIFKLSTTFKLFHLIFGEVLMSFKMMTNISQSFMPFVQKFGK